jgi:hypothetical protein
MSAWEILGYIVNRDRFHHCSITRFLSTCRFHCKSSILCSQGAQGSPWFPEVMRCVCSCFSASEPYGEHGFIETVSTMLTWNEEIDNNESSNNAVLGPHSKPALLADLYGIIGLLWKTRDSLVSCHMTWRLTGNFISCLFYT